MKRLFLVMTTLLLLVAGLWIFHGRREHRRTFFVFNTPCTLTLWGSGEAEPAFQRAMAELQSLHDTINIYDAASELSVLNRTAHKAPVVCSDRLWDILQAARRAYRLSEGAYDPTVGPLMRLWGYHGKKSSLPDDAEITAALARVGLDKVRFDDGTRSVFFTVAGMSLDLGGIAKGYACDKARAILESAGWKRYLIDLGGNLMLSALPPPGASSFTVGIRDPRQPQRRLLDTVELLDCAVASSGNYERARVIADKKIGHIMDPRTGRPGVSMAGTTAITKNGADSDAFSTAVFIRGQKLADSLRAQVPGTRFVLVTD